MTGLAVLPEHGRVGVVGGVAEHRVKDGHAVGSDDADSTELLDDAQEDNNQEGLVDFRVIFYISNVVTLPLFVSPVRSSSHDKINCKNAAGPSKHLLSARVQTETAFIHETGWPFLRCWRLSLMLMTSCLAS